MLKRAFLVLALFAATSSQALATGEILCSGDENLTVEMNVGRLQVLFVNRIVVTIGSETWSSQPEVAPGAPITVGQAFQDDRQLMVDITDDIVNEVLGRLRVFTAEEGENHVMGGVFTFKGKGAFVVDCAQLE